jgi:hypothetical protein
MIQVLGLNYDKALDSLQREMKLLEDDRVLIDAKGFTNGQWKIFLYF